MDKHEKKCKQTNCWHIHPEIATKDGSDCSIIRQIKIGKGMPKTFIRVGIHIFKPLIMNASKIFIGTGALVLTAAAVFAGRASVKSSVSPIYISTVGGACKQLTVVASTTFTTGSLTAVQATVKTSGGINKRKLWATSNCQSGAKPVHFNG
jgi:hypothetical protein